MSRAGRIVKRQRFSPPTTSRVQGVAVRARRRALFLGGFQPPRRQGFKRNQRTAGFLGIELKFYDTSLVASGLLAPTDSAGGEHDPSATILLNTVIRGDSEQNRDGKQISMRSISIVGTVSVAKQANQTVSDEAPHVMIALVLDTQTNGATVNSEDVYKNQSANAALAASPLRNLLFAKRFRVLKTVKMDLPQAEMTYDGTNIEINGYHVGWEMHADLNGMKVNYNSGTTESVANIIDNSLHIIAFCSSQNLGPDINYNARLRFVG